MKLFLLFAMFGAAFSRDIPPGTPIAQCKDKKVLECPDFKLVAVKKEYEVRQYPALKWVSTIYSGMEPDDSKMFMKLFNYIQGANSKGEKIPMTAPVMTVVSPGPGPTCASNFTMSFFVPTAHWADTPKPTDKDVFLQSTPETTHYVKAFSGFASFEDYTSEAKKLQKALGNTTVDETIWLKNGYDAPFKLFNRRNEVVFIAK